MEDLLEVTFNIKPLGGGVSSNELFLFNIPREEKSASWIKIDTEGPGPEGRYGHSLSYTSPYIVLFGGYCKKEPSNDTWVLSIEEMPFVWQRLEWKCEIPSPRAYHTATVCEAGKASGMIILFGGRSEGDLTLGDTWVLKKHSAENWEWIKAPYNSKVIPKARYQVRFLLIIIAHVDICGDIKYYRRRKTNW